MFVYVRACVCLSVCILRNLRNNVQARVSTLAIFIQFRIKLSTDIRYHPLLRLEEIFNEEEEEEKIENEKNKINIRLQPHVN